MAQSINKARKQRKQHGTDDLFKRERSDKHQQCEVCTRVAYRGTDVVMPMLDGGDEADFDAGIYEYIYRTGAPGEEESACLDAAAARKTAERCARHIRRLQSELAKAGIIQKEEQRYTGSNDFARIIAPFKMEEIEVGTLLGTGGFSSVYEITAFRLDADLSSAVEPFEQKARENLKDTAQKPAECTAGESKWQEQVHIPSHQGSPRYAIKHLRKGLVKEPEKFERAAIDLVLEAQLLLGMDHPNIISLRAWSNQGVGGFATGKHTSFFFVIDKLPETLEDRIFKWRAAVRKYRSRMKIPFQKQKYCSKLDDVLINRLQVAHDVAAAVEYMHEKRIINRDLKATNIGFDVLGVLKLFDFGLSRMLPTRKEHMEDSYLMSRVGTKYYMAPEIRRKIPYNLSADVYSYGVCLWEILSMGSPREALKKLKEEGTAPMARCPLPVCRCWPEQISNMLTGCLLIGPIYRPAISDVRYNIELVMEQMGHRIRVDHTRRRTSLRVNLGSLGDDGKFSEAKEEITPLKKGVRSLKKGVSITAPPQHGFYSYPESGTSSVDNFAHRTPSCASSAIESNANETITDDGQSGPSDITTISGDVTTQSGDITMQSDLTEKQLMAIRAKMQQSASQQSDHIGERETDSNPSTKASRRTDVVPNAHQKSTINSAIARKLATSSSRPETEITAATDGTN